LLVVDESLVPLRWGCAMRRTSKQVVLDGFVAGLLGYVAVVLLFAFLNVASLQGVFRTPELLGRALLGGLTDGGDGPGSALAPVLVFNGFHLLVSLGLGLVASHLAEAAEHDHGLGYGLAFGIIALGGFVPIFGGAIAVELLQAISWRDVLAGSFVGAVATLGYVTWVHRELVRTLFAEAKV
jgi:hypothetical protein